MKKLIMTLGVTVMTVAPSLVAVSCGDSSTEAPKGTTQAQLDSFVETYVSGLVAPTDKTIALLDAEVKSDFTTATKGALDDIGFTGTSLSSRPSDVTVKYTFIKTTSTQGSKAIYTFTFKGESGTLTAKTLTKTVTSIDDVPVVVSDQQKADSDRDQLSSFNKSNDVAIATLDGKVTTDANTFATFDQATATSLGFGNIPTLTNSSTISYSLVNVTKTPGSKATYSLKLRATKNAATSDTTAKTLTSSNDVPIPGVVETINATSMTADQLVNDIVGKLNIGMSVKAGTLVKDKTAFLAYLNGITLDKSIKVTYNATEYIMDFRTAVPHLNGLIDLVDNNKQGDNAGKGTGIRGIAYWNNYSSQPVVSRNIPSMLAFTNILLGNTVAYTSAVTAGDTLAPFYELSPTQFTYTGSGTSGDTQTDASKRSNKASAQASINDNWYAKMLIELNTIFTGFIESNTFAQWNVNKTYTVPLVLPAASGAFPTNFVNLPLKSGTYFDDPAIGSRLLILSGIKSTNIPLTTDPTIDSNDVNPIQKVSNFEALFTSKMFKLDGYAEGTLDQLKDSVVYTTKQDIIAGETVITEANFAPTSVTPEGLATLPNGWTPARAASYSISASARKKVFYVSVSQRDTLSPKFDTAYYHDFGMDVVQATTDLKYLGFINTSGDAALPTGNADDTTAGSTLPDGWLRTDSFTNPALASATYKFFLYSNTPANNRVYYRTTDFSDDYKALATTWDSYKVLTIQEPIATKMVNGTPTVAGDLDINSITDVPKNAWFDVDAAIIAKYGLEDAVLQTPDGYTLQWKFGAASNVTGQTGKRLPLSYRLKKGNDYTYVLGGSPSAANGMKGFYLYSKEYVRPA